MSKITKSEAIIVSTLMTYLDEDGFRDVSVFEGVGERNIQKLVNEVDTHCPEVLTMGMMLSSEDVFGALKQFIDDKTATAQMEEKVETEEVAENKSVFTKEDAIILAVVGSALKDTYGVDTTDIMGFDKTLKYMSRTAELYGEDVTEKEVMLGIFKDIVAKL